MALGGRLAREASRRQVNRGTPAWGQLSVGAAHACAGGCLPVCSAGGKSAVPQCTYEGVCEAVCLCICSGVSVVYVCACLHANERVLHLLACLSMCTSEWFSAHLRGSWWRQDSSVERRANIA